jgi:type IV pilus assembly protein PilP
MRSKTMRLCLVAMAVLLVAPVDAQAQAPAAAEAQAAPAPEQAPPDAEPAAEPASLDELLEERPDGYAYDPQGRRDPFVSLHHPVARGDEEGKPPGIEGFLIQELALKGIVQTPEGYVTLLEGPDNKSYFVRLGQRVYDGEVIAIDLATITFRQDVTDPLSPVRFREVVKSLYPSEEARQ